MARIKFSALVTEIRGTIGGTTFQRNAYGYTIKQKPNMLVPYSEGQQFAKSQMSQIARAWRTLTEAQRQDWNTYAENNPRPSRLNPDAYLSGYNLFLLYHRYSFLRTPVLLTSPSLVLQSLGAVDNVFYNNAGVYEWEGNPGVVTGNWDAFLFLTPVIPFGREYVNFTPRYITSNVWSAGFLRNITAFALSYFGAIPATGQWVGVKIVYVCRTTAQVYVAPTVQYEVQ